MHIQAFDGGGASTEGTEEHNGRVDRYNELKIDRIFENIEITKDHHQL